MKCLWIWATATEGKDGMVTFSEQERKRYIEAKDAILGMIDRILEQETNKDWHFLTQWMRQDFRSVMYRYLDD